MRWGSSYAPLWQELCRLLFQVVPISYFRNSRMAAQSEQVMPKKMRKPKSGGKPKQIKTKNKPGGPHTPGAKKRKKKKGK